MSNRVLLYVEDEDAAAFLLETALEETRILVDFFRVSNGEQALAFLRKDGAYSMAPSPDLVLLDLNLPKLNGFQVLEEMRKNQSLSSIPVVVFTSSSLASDRTKAFGLGANDFITKPSNLEDFFQVVGATCSPLSENGQRGGFGR